MTQNAKKPLYLWSVLTNKCPRCRKGNLFVTESAFNFKEGMKMHTNCPVCGQPTEIEVGFYFGTGYVSYAVTVFISIVTFLAWWLIIGFSLTGNGIFYWLAFNAILLLVLQPPIMRFSRTLWLSWFVKYKPDWESTTAKNYERVVKDHMNNW